MYSYEFVMHIKKKSKLAKGLEIKNEYTALKVIEEL